MRTDITLIAIPNERKVILKKPFDNNEYTTDLDKI